MAKNVASEQRQIIRAQADSAKKTIESLDGDDVRLDIKKRIGALIDEFELIHEMLYLEARLIGQKYHEQKESAPEFGHTYGYLNAHVEMLTGIIQMRFQSRYPTGAKGKFDRTFLKKNKTGYSRFALSKIAAHDYELNNAMEAELGFQNIRNDAAFVKKTIKALKAIQAPSIQTISSKGKY